MSICGDAGTPGPDSVQALIKKITSPKDQEMTADDPVMDGITVDRVHVRK